MNKLLRNRNNLPEIHAINDSAGCQETVTEGEVINSDKALPWESSSCFHDNFQVYEALFEYNHQQGQIKVLIHFLPSDLPTEPRSSSEGKVSQLLRAQT